MMKQSPPALVVAVLSISWIATFANARMVINRPIQHRQSEKVLVEIFYETLCPDSIDFIVQQLHPTLKKINSIMNVSLVPFGIATEEEHGDQYSFRCQHGPRECKGNIIQTCAINLITTDQNLSLEFIYCMERSRDPSSAGPNCAKAVGVDFAPIADCSTSKQGNFFQHIMAQRQLALDPKVNWVPWIVINGVHTDDIQQKGSADLLGLVCSTYQGQKPPGCMGLQGTRFNRDGMNSSL